MLKSVRCSSSSSSYAAIVAPFSKGPNCATPEMTLPSLVSEFFAELPESSPQEIASTEQINAKKETFK